ncbi:MAG: hypothetical protein GX072_03300 [Lysinibacillus sp.]|nr:hypothetical protein [Lysinibacillus sp.]
MNSESSKKNQATRVVWANSEVVLARNGNLDGMVGYVQDITDFYLPEGINKE